MRRVNPNKIRGFNPNMTLDDHESEVINGRFKTRKQLVESDSEEKMPTSRYQYSDSASKSVPRQ